jgi:transcriptional regulator with XRE-family HTH domain
MDFRELVKAWLTRRGWSQGDLARAAEISPSLVSKHLSEDDWRRVKPSPANLARYAPILDVPYEELMRMNGYLPGEASIPAETDQVEADIRATVAKLLQAVEGAPPIFWPAMVRPLLDGMVDTVRDMAARLIEVEAERSTNTAPPLPSNTTPGETSNRRSRRSRGEINRRDLVPVLA